ncbi:hypothetical protein DH2020_018960 [Rehmannia glutinosa]|uniref:Uncharacterized protein n=1 Tax=Rehmannia glutinosa TaxID=99300 RepID=A0ABR0WKF2_REHGL
MGKRQHQDRKETRTRASSLKSNTRGHWANPSGLTIDLAEVVPEQDVATDDAPSVPTDAGTSGTTSDETPLATDSESESQVSEQDAELNHALDDHATESSKQTPPMAATEDSLQNLRPLLRMLGNPSLLTSLHLHRHSIPHLNMNFSLIKMLTTYLLFIGTQDLMEITRPGEPCSSGICKSPSPVHADRTREEGNAIDVEVPRFYHYSRNSWIDWSTGWYSNSSSLQTPKGLLSQCFRGNFTSRGGCEEEKVRMRDEGSGAGGDDFVVPSSSMPRSNDFDGEDDSQFVVSHRRTQPHHMVVLSDEDESDRENSPLMMMLRWPSASEDVKENVGTLEPTSDSEYDLLDVYSEFFYSTDAVDPYQVFKGRKFIEEKVCDHTSFERYNLNKFFIRRTLVSTIDTVVPYIEKVVHEFYANLTYDVGNKQSAKFGKVFVRNKPYDFSPSVINEFFGTPDCEEGRQIRDFNLVLKVLTENKMTLWPAHPKKVSSSALTSLYGSNHICRSTNPLRSANYFHCSNNYSECSKAVGILRGLRSSISRPSLQVFWTKRGEASNVPAENVIPSTQAGGANAADATVGNSGASTNYMHFLTRMPNGAMNTHKENTKQIHPTMLARSEAFTRKRVATMINPNPQTISRTSTLTILGNSPQKRGRIEIFKGRDPPIAEVVKATTGPPEDRDASNPRKLSIICDSLLSMICNKSPIENLCAPLDIQIPIEKIPTVKQTKSHIQARRFVGQTKSKREAPRSVGKLSPIEKLHAVGQIKFYREISRSIVCKLRT